MAKAIASDGYNMVIYDIENGINDYVIWGYADEKKQRRSKIYYTQSSGRAYWMKPGEWDFYYPLSAKTGRISGEGMDYFRKPKIVKKRRS